MKHRNAVHKRKSFYLLCLFLPLFSLFGCTPGPIAVFMLDVSTNHKLWGGYAQNATYTLKHNVFLAEVKNEPYIRFESNRLLVPPSQLTEGVRGLYYYPTPSTMDQYFDLPNNYPEIKGIVKAGTVIKCKLLTKYIPLGSYSAVYIFAEIVDGEHQGEVVEINDLSIMGDKDESGLILSNPNPVLLSKNEKE